MLNYNYPKLYKKYQKKNLFNVLKKMGYPQIPLSSHDTITQVGFGCNQKRIWCADYNFTAGVGIARDKNVTNDFLNNIGIPAPQSYTVKTKEKFEEVVTKIGFPLVMKPARGTHGGKGVKVNILEKTEALAAFNEIQKIDEKVLVEKFYTGNDHRVLVINYKVVAVLQRVPAHVIGDGKSNIKNLIEKENLRRKNLPLEKTASCRQLTVDKTTVETIAKQGFNYESVPKKGTVIKLRFNANVGTGGTTVGMTDKIHPENKKICEKAARLMGLQIAGVDVVTEDIGKPITETGSVIIEVNTRPGIVMHQFPGSGQPVDTISIFAQEILGPAPKLWIPIIISGKKCLDIGNIESHFEDKPKKVWQKESYQSQKEVVINKPSQKLVTYLMDILTTKVEL